MKYLVNKTTKEHRLYDGELHGDLPNHKYKIVKADPEGWIKHDGGECPLLDGHRYDIKDRSGHIYRSFNRPETLDWGHYGDHLDVVAYRPILDDKAEAKYPEWDAALTYKDGDKVTLNGQVVTIGDVIPDDLVAKDAGMTQSEGYDNQCRRLGFDPAEPDLLDRLKSAHKAANELPDIIAELREVLEPVGLGIVHLSEFAEPETPVDTTQDMTDWRNWREGDVLECIEDSCLRHYLKGEKYQIKEIDPTRQNQIKTVSDGRGSLSNGWAAEKFKFHSRPTKEQKR